MLTKSEQRLRGQVAAHAGWARETDRRARTQPGRDARDAKINEKTIEAIEATKEGAWAGMSPDDQQKALASGRKEHFKSMALEASKARRAKRLVAEANARAAIEAVEL